MIQPEMSTARAGRGAHPAACCNSTLLLSALLGTNTIAQTSVVDSLIDQRAKIVFRVIEADHELRH